MKTELANYLNAETEKLKLKQKIDRIDCQLSPENLHCDGEITHTQAARKARALWKERAILEKELGEQVPYRG